MPTEPAEPSAPYIKKTVHKSSGRFLRYNLWWSPYTDPLAMELDMIKHGGKWVKQDGGEAGMGLFFHYRKFQELAWPEKLWEKGPFKNHWAEKCLEVYLNHTYIGGCGCASSGKSDSFGSNVLTDWYSQASCTTVLVSSTDLKSLELRIWGMIKKYHKSVKKEHPWLPGYLIEGKQMLTLDSKDECSEGRDFKNGIMAVACFPSGSCVDTPSGPKEIQTLGVGDVVYNASGTGRITSVHNRISHNLVRVRLSDGRVIDCTEEHPFFTGRGWVNAIDLETFDTVFSHHETMRLMWGRYEQALPEPEILLSPMCGKNARKALRSMRSAFPPSSLSQQELLGEILLSEMFERLGFSPTGVENSDYQTLRFLQNRDGRHSSQPGLLLGGVPEAYDASSVCLLRQGVQIHQRWPVQAEEAMLQHKMQSNNNSHIEWKKSDQANAGGVVRMEGIHQLCLPASSSDWTYHEGGQQALLRLGPWVPGNKTGRRDRRRDSQDSREAAEGRDQDQGSGIHRVDRVEIFKSTSDERYSVSEGGYRVYNIEVDGHPSYSVNGVVVHNCRKGSSYVGLSNFVGIHNKRVRILADELNLMPRAFLDAASNLSKCEDFKMVGLGNPNETTNAHGTLCEPASELGGWEGGVDQAPGTKTWPTRFPNGICIQLPGSDSPNMRAAEGEPPPFPFLMTRQQMEDDAKIWGISDWHYAMMNDAKMPRGQGSRRVLTRQACNKFGAFKEPNWRDTRRTKIAFLDAAYRGVGGDRCVFGELQFGMEAEPLHPDKLLSNIISQKPSDNSGKIIIALVDLTTIPITSAQGSESPEDQIVKFVMESCGARDIIPENFYYDAGMRTSLVSAFARAGWQQSNTIDCGGKPTETQVSSEIRTLCRDYYSKFVTELWFSVRMAVESGQFRGMTEEAATEFCQREWKTVSGNRIEIESKDDYKLKAGRSCDLADAVSIGLFGARQKGFVITKLSSAAPDFKRGPHWMDELKKKARKLAASGQLNFKA